MAARVRINIARGVARLTADGDQAGLAMWRGGGAIRAAALARDVQQIAFLQRTLCEHMAAFGDSRRLLHVHRFTMGACAR